MQGEILDARPRSQIWIVIYAHMPIYTNDHSIIWSVLWPSRWGQTGVIKCILVKVISRIGCTTRTAREGGWQCIVAVKGCRTANRAINSPPGVINYSWLTATGSRWDSGSSFASSSLLLINPWRKASVVHGCGIKFMFHVCVRPHFDWKTRVLQ